MRWNLLPGSSSEATSTAAGASESTHPSPDGAATSRITVFLEGSRVDRDENLRNFALGD